jgi:2'-5' RNA ligase
MRAFFAAFPGREDVLRIRNVVRGLGVLDARSVQWVRVASYHVTLRFLGNIDSAQVSAMSVLTRDVLDCAAPVAVTATGISLWPLGRRPRLAVLELDSNGRLAALAAHLNAALIDGGYGGPDKPFVAHLTLARLSHPMAMELTDELPALELALSRIGLFESVTCAEGAIYRPVFVR